MPVQARQSAPNGRDTRGRFAAGNRGGGRPKQFHAFREEAKRFMEHEGLARLLAMARADSEFALKLLVEYAFGKPTQPISGDPDLPALQITVHFDHADAHSD